MLSMQPCIQIRRMTLRLVWEHVILRERIHLGSKQVLLLLIDPYLGSLANLHRRRR